MLTSPMQSGLRKAKGRMTQSDTLDERLTNAYRTSGLFANDAAQTVYNPSAMSTEEAAEGMPIISAISVKAPQSMEVSRRRLF